MRASDDTQPCSIYFGNVGNHDVDHSNDSSNNEGIGRIEYFNKAGHTADEMHFSVSDGLDPPSEKLALCINTSSGNDAIIDICGNLNVSGDVCFTGIARDTTTKTLYYNETTRCITFDDINLVDPGAGNLTITGNLTVDGTTTLNDKLVVDADASLCDVSACNLQVDGDASLCDVSACNLTVNENTWLRGGLDVLGATNLKGTLNAPTAFFLILLPLQDTHLYKIFLLLILVLLAMLHFVTYLLAILMLLELLIYLMLLVCLTSWL